MSQLYKHILKHYESVHKYEPNFKVTCNIDNCQMKYTSIRSLKFHIKRKHVDFFSQHFKQNAQYELDLNYARQVEDQEEIGIDSDNDDMDAGHVLAPQIEIPGNSQQYDYHKRLATFLTDLRENHKASASACASVSEELKHIVELSNTHMAARIQNALQEGKQLDETLLAEILVQQNRSVLSACEDLATAKKQEQYIVDHLEYIEPEEHNLNVGGIHQHTMQYIPILKTLKAMLNHEDVLAHVLQNRALGNGKYQDFCDGEVYRNNTLFATNPNALIIELYYDDFTVTNQIGVRAKKHKISAFYFLLGNLPPKHRSKLDLIQLLCLCNHTLVKQYGLSAVLQPVLTDLQHLERNGLIITFEGRQYHFYGTVSFMASDNLAAHAVGKYFENFSTVTRICRFCTATRNEIQNLTTDVDCVMRTTQMYDTQATLAENDATMARVYGVKGKSILNDLHYFHVINGLPADIAHDMLEGVVPQTVCKVLDTLIDEDLFSIERLNELVTNYPYNDIDKTNKLGTIYRTQQGALHLGASQSQMWSFARLLPLIIGHLVPEDHEHWNVLLHLLTALEYMCAPKYTRADIEIMRGTIEEFIDYYKVVYPGERIKPKMHYITHYPHLTLKFGPLIYCWTMRLEGKHLYFKGIFQKTKNRKNVCKTMAESHQRRQAIIHDRANYLTNNDFQCVRQKMVFVRFLETKVENVLNEILQGAEEVCQAAKVAVDGITYIQNCGVVIGENDGEIVFGCIHYIFIINNKPYLCCQKLKTLEYNRHLNCYVVERQDEFSLLNTEELVDVHPLSIYIKNGDMCLIVKHHISL